jgi:hypothetical protein
MLRTTIYATLIVILTTATVSAQTDKQGLPGYTNSVRTDLEKKNDREIDRAYQSTVKGRPDADKKKSDPWADVRPAPRRRQRTSNNGWPSPAHRFLLSLGGRPTIQFQAPIVQTMFQRRLPYCGVEFDTCLASCLTSSISTQSGKLDGKEAFGRHELVVLKMQSLPSGFQSGNSSDHSRVLSVTFSCRLFIGVLASGKHSCKVRRDSNFSHRTIPRRVCRTESVLLCE